MYLDYGPPYDRARSVFGADEVRLVFLEAVSGTGKDITTALLDTLEVLPPGLELDPLPASRANVSPEPLAAWAANQVSAPAIAGQPLVDLATAAFAEVRRRRPLDTSSPRRRPRRSRRISSR